MQLEGSKLLVRSYEVAVFVENTLRSLWLVLNEKWTGLSESGIRLRNIEAFSSSQKTNNSFSYKYQSVNAACCQPFGTKYAIIYRVSQEECARLREGVPYVKVYRYNPKDLCPELNGYGDNGQRKVWFSGGTTHCTCQLTTLSMPVLECGFILRQFSLCSQ